MDLISHPSDQTGAKYRSTFKATPVAYKKHYFSGAFEYLTQSKASIVHKHCVLLSIASPPSSVRTASGRHESDHPPLPAYEKQVAGISHTNQAAEQGKIQD